MPPLVNVETGDPVHTLVNPIDLFGALLKTVAQHPPCRRCGCTTFDCTRCIGRTGLPCSWVHTLVNGVEYDLCSACAPLLPTVEKYDQRIERAELFVAKLGVFDLWSLALAEERGGGEHAIEAALSAWRAAKRGLLAKTGSRLTVGLDESIEIAIAVMVEDRVSSLREKLEQMTRSRHFSVVARSSLLAPFVYLTEPDSVRMARLKSQPRKPKHPQQPNPQPQKENL